MKPGITYGEVELRVNRAFRWLLKDESGRWPVFRAIRERYLPYRLMPQCRLEACLCGMTGGEGVMSKEAMHDLDYYWDRPAVHKDMR